MSRKHLGIRRALLFAGSAPAAPRLLKAGIFSDLVAPTVASLSDALYSGSTSAGILTRTTPVKKKNIVIDTATTVSADYFAIFFWADTLIFTDNTSGMDMTATAGNAGSGGSFGGNGGGGGSGGWGGQYSDTISPGAAYGTDGTDGPMGLTTGGGSPGAGGSGFGVLYQSASTPFPWITGGTGSGAGAPTSSGPWGATGQGGLAKYNGGTADAGGGAGGGGGFIGGVFKSISGPGFVIANGNSGGLGNQPDGDAGNGGGGVIMLFAQKYDGQLVYLVDGGTGGSLGSASAGNARIYEIAHNGVTIAATHTNFADSWDNT